MPARPPATRRFRAPAALVGGLAVAVVVAAALWSLAGPDTDGAPAPHPIHRVELRRGAPPRRIPAPAYAPAPAPAPGSGPEAARIAAPQTPPAASEPAPAPPGGPAPPTADTRDLDDLDGARRDRLTHAALDHLHALVAACADQVLEPQTLAAFVRLDARGVAEVDLEPIDPDGGPITVADRALPQALVTCLDDALWRQDWSVEAGDAVEDGSQLAFALSLRLEPE